MRLHIESLAYGGDAVGHLDDGRATFVRLGCPGDIEPVGFWLYCLAQSLLSSSRPEIRREFSPGNEDVGYIQGLLDSSAGYCSRAAAMAERQASRASTSSTESGESPATGASTGTTIPTA